MKLIGSLTSPFVRKTRLVLAEKKIDYEFVLDSPWVDGNSVAKYNPLGKIPVLVLDDESTLYDSRVIVEYLDTLSPVARLLPQSGRERAAVKCWEAIADGLLDASVTIVRERMRPAAQQSAEWIERHYGKINASLDAMNKSLGDHQYCMGINYTLADIAVGCALGYLDLRFPDLGWRNSQANLTRLYDKLAVRQSFIDTVPQV